MLFEVFQALLCTFQIVSRI